MRVRVRVKKSFVRQTGTGGHRNRKTVSTGPKKSRLRRLLRWSTITATVWLLAWFAVPWCFPWPQELNSAPVPAASFTDREGVPLRRLLENNRRAGEAMPLTEIPTALILATLAAEDRRFRSHGGVDLLATARALKDSLAAGRGVSGASTITQQLVKIVHPRKRNVWTKIVEAFTARRIEMTWDKDRILAAYLNRLDYGSLTGGCSEAAWTFFDKPLTDCSLAECAFLAGLPQATTRLSPWRNPEGAKKRQEWVLSRMRELEWITPDEYTRAVTEPLRTVRKSSAFRAPHFVDMILAGLPDEPAAGASLRTTLDMAIQEHCERCVRDRLSRLRTHNAHHAAVVVLDNATGHILALVGSPDYAGTGSGQVNGATSRRSPGSALKPFTYLLAFQQGQSPADIVPDLPVEFMTPTGVYRPENYNHRAAGPVSLRQALANSLNLSAVRTLQQHGGARALVEALQSCGINTLTKKPEDYGLGLTIGGGEVTLLELATAYSCIARMGTHRPPVMLADAPLSPEVRIFDPVACWLVADVMADNEARIRSFGLDSALRLPFPVAVKTGTSTDYRDNWTMGFNARFTVGVWVGNFDNSPMRGVSGVTGAAPIFRDIFSWLEVRWPSPWYPRPEEIIEVEVDPLTGKPVPPRLAGKRPAVVEKFVRDHAPDSSSGGDAYDAAGRVLLPSSYAAWLAGPDNWLGAAAVASDRAEPGSFRILSPLPGASVLLDPDLPDGGRRLLLRSTVPSSEVEWSSPTLKIETTPRGAFALLEPGEHKITGRHRTTGESLETAVVVRKL
jgi:penicillin-binding protein 1C